MEFRAEEVWNDRRRIEEIQLARLQHLLKAIVPRNRFWDTRFREAGISVASVQSLSDLSSLPFLLKEDLVQNQAAQPPYGSNTTFPSTHYCRVHQTSGTTGRPLRWLDTRDSWDWIMECWRQIYLLAGLRSDDRLFFPFSFGPFIGFWAAFEGACRLNHFCLAGGGMSTPIRLQAMLENEATVVCCTPTYALRMADEAESLGIDLKESSVRMLIVAGEPGGSIASTRERLESVWEARVIDHWGMTEIASLGSESENRPGGLYLLETECIAEIVHPETLQPVNHGEIGELVITNLGRIGSPLIRYRTRDLVRASVAEDPAGRKLTWLEGGILGRSDDMVIVRGNNVFPSSIEAVVREFAEVAEYRIDVTTVRSMQELSVTVEPRPDCSVTDEDLAGRVRQTLRQRLGFGCDVHLAAPGSLPRFELKGRRLHRTEAQSAGGESTEDQK